ncbi:9686_t:CDS:2, partial [Acaulospora morrowiae]
MVVTETIENTSLNDSAQLLMNSINRNMIFPPHYNSPEELINPSKAKTSGIPRPPNGFLLCRKNVHKQAKQHGICNMRVISKVTGMLWRSATPDEKEQYEKLAMQVQNLHSVRYPGYKYKPAARTKPPTYRHKNQRHQHQPYPIPQPTMDVPTQIQAPMVPYYQIFPTLGDFTQENIDILSLLYYPYDRFAETETFFFLEISPRIIRFLLWAYHFIYHCN